MSDEYVKVNDLTSFSRRVNLKVKVIEKQEPKSVVSSKDGSTYTVAEALIADETGCVLLNLWNEDVKKFNVGDVLEIKNGYVKPFRGSIRLNIGRYGEANIIEEDMAKVNSENNVSERT